MAGIPLVVYQAKFTAAGQIGNPFKIDAMVPLQQIPTKWSLQVTGYNAAGVNVAATSWNVTLQGSLDGVGYDTDATAMLAHTNGTNPDGTVSKAGAVLMVVRFFQLHCQALSLGAGVSYIMATVVAVDD